MYNAAQLSLKYLRYYFRSLNGKGHGIHSPFIFDLVTNVLNDHRRYYAYDRIEGMRKELSGDKTKIPVLDFGAGSARNNKRERSISSITKNTSKNPKFGQLLFRIAHYFKPSMMVELGTSFGISTAYLASGHPKGKLITCEGSEEIALVADRNFKYLDIKNISIAGGNFDDKLPDILSELNTLDLGFIDGNHRREPTLRYFEWMLQKMNSDTIFIFDDIHWSEEMEGAWELIKGHQAVTATIDLFFIGLVFFRPGFKAKQHFTIRF